MKQIIPYLHFNGRCREAMSFYQQCIGGELILEKLAESPMAARMPSEMGSRILHGSLMQDGLLLMASDILGEEVYSGNVVVLYMRCSSLEELYMIFEKLAINGQISEPLHQSFRGATSGKLTDKFGIHWIFQYSKD